MSKPRRNGYFLLGGRWRWATMCSFGSFQEYLAARHLTGEQEAKEPEEIADLVRNDPERWQEVVLLAIAKIIRGYAPSAWSLIDALAPDLPPHTPDPNAAWAAYIAAAAIIENDLYRNVPPKHRQKVERLQQWLVIALEHALLPPIQRATAGYVLAKLGDTRQGVTSLPLLLTSAIQGATGTFQASLYPVTNAQFKRFISAKGYQTPRWWSESGRFWLQNPPPYRGEAITEPNHRHEVRLNADNQPVVGISYYEAEAFCGWLSEQEGRPYRLPTEEEWQQLAQGNDGRTYPWGNDWQANAANSHQSGIGKPSAVGLFPAGISPSGAHECAGNVWEWCATWYDHNQPTNRVLRGGSWDSNQDEVRCEHRFEMPPKDSNHVTGFRVVVELGL